MSIQQVILDNAQVDQQRARDRRGHCWRVRDRCEYRVPSKSEEGTWYTVQRSSDRWTCQCWGYKRHGHCYHLGIVQRRAQREGWLFHDYLEPDPDVVMSDAEVA